MELKKRSSSLDQEDSKAPTDSSATEKQLGALEEADTTMFLFTSVPVKTEEDEEELQPSQLHQRPSKQMEAGADGEPEDCGRAEPAPERHSRPETKVKSEDSSGAETDDSDDWREIREHQTSLDSQGRGGISHGAATFDFDSKRIICPESDDFENNHMKVVRNNHNRGNVFSDPRYKNQVLDREHLSQHMMVNNGAHRGPKQEDSVSPLIKEEHEEVWISQDRTNNLTFTSTPVKSEDDEEKPQPSQLHDIQDEQMETRADGGVCGRAEPARTSDPETHLQPETEDMIEDSYGSDDSSDSDSREQQPGFTSKKKKRKPQSCSECGKTLLGNQNLIKHMRIHTGEKPFSCSFCSKRFAQKGNLTRHLVVHMEEKPFRCSLCSKSFKLKVILTAHMAVHRGEKHFSCFECGQRFQRQGNLTQHMLIHKGEKPFSCPFCDKSFTRKGILNTHLLFHTGEEPFSCSECGKRFKEKRFLTSHMLLHRGEKPFSCPQCCQKFTQKGNLSRHILIHTEEEPFVCSECGKRFKLKSILNRHMLVHRAEKPFQCSKCCQQFKRRKGLTTHMLVHRTEKPFQCSKCRQRFKRKGGLTRHMLVHSGTEPFSCSECGKGFHHQSDLTRHMLVHGGEKPFSCSECGRSYINKGSLTRHLLDHRRAEPSKDSERQSEKDTEVKPEDSVPV